MKHDKISVCQDSREYPDTISVGKAIKMLSIKHAGDQHMQHLLQNPDDAPSFMSEKLPHPKVAALLFGGAVHKDEHNNAYINALYFDKYKNLVVEKYWLSYPMLENARFAVAL